VPRSIAYTVAFGLGVLISYFANRRFVFDVGGSGSRFIIFASVPLMQFALTLSLLELLVFCGVDQRISLGISILAIYPFVFLASRFVFEIIKLPKGREFTSRIRGAKKKGGGIIRS
jgi:putative flippase GtrA